MINTFNENDPFMEQKQMVSFNAIKLLEILEKFLHLIPTFGPRCFVYLCNADGKRAWGEQTEEPDQRLWKVLDEDCEERQAAEHHRQQGAHRAGKLGLLKQWRDHEGEENLPAEMRRGRG